MNRRIYGTEIEYGSMITDGRKPVKMEADEKAHVIEGRLDNLKTKGCVGQFHMNSSRIYMDMRHLEYATPECSSAQEAVAAEMAGSRLIVANISRSKNENDLTRVLFFKETVGFNSATVGAYNDSNGSRLNYVYDKSVGVVSSACHENYSFNTDKVCSTLGFLLPIHMGYNHPEKESFERFVFSKLCPFLITRQIISGAGTFLFGKFNLSARTNFISIGISTNTRGENRPLFNTRELYNGYGNSRLHFIIGDANMSEVANFLKLGTTGMVLSLLEDNLIPEDIQISEANIDNRGMDYLCVELMKKICVDMTFSEKIIPLRNGEFVSSVELQRRYYNIAYCHYFREAPRNSLEEEAQLILKWWDFVLTCLESGSYEKLTGVTDWATKLFLGKSLLKKYGISTNDLPEAILEHRENKTISARLRGVEQKYHELSGESFYEILKSKGIMKTIIDDNKVEELMHNPPKGTRAFGRGHFIKFALKTNFKPYLLTVDWNQISFNVPGEHKNFDMYDPFLPVTLQMSGYLVNNGYSLPI